MKRLSNKKAVVMIVVIAVALILASAYGFYSRPMTISERYPMLTLDKCVAINGYYREGYPAIFMGISDDINGEDLEKLFDLLCAQEYHRSLRDLLPRGTRIGNPKSDGIEWGLSILFTDISLPDGRTEAILGIESWYGELNIHVNNERFSCYTNEQETWAREVLDIIRDS